MVHHPSSSLINGRYLLRLGSVFALALLAALLLGHLLPATAAGTAFPITETFANAQPGPGWKLGGVATTTAASGIDPVGRGWLRLTGMPTYQNGYAIYDVPFSSTNGVLITFDYMTWGAAASSQGADGLTVFLYDGAILSNTFQPGGYGGSLGYAQRAGFTGLTGGYVGLGIDEFGNFSNPNEGRIGGPGSRPDSIVIRGPGSGMTGYAYLTGTLVGGSIDVSGVSTRPDPAGTGYRKVEIDIEPISGTYKITAKFQSGASGTLKTIINQYTLPSAPPANLKIGFAASTGSLSNYHEIRNLNITTHGIATILNGTVSASTGGAIPDATVRITDTVAHSYTSAVTGSGRYAFTNTVGMPLVAGPISVTTTANGYCPAVTRAQVVNGVTTTQDISLTPTTVSGFILEAGKGVPIVGANVILTDSVGTVLNTTSGSGGAYSISSSIGARLRSGLITITAAITDYAVYSTTATIGSCATPIDLLLSTADLMLTNTDGRSNVAPGDVLTYTLTLTNYGTLPAANVIITDTLSPYLTYITDTTGISPSILPGNIYQWTRPASLAPNAGMAFTLRARVAAVLPDGITAFNNTARATTAQPEADVTQNIKQDADTVTAHPNLMIFKSATASSVPVLQNANLQYTYAIENRGTATATTVLITDVLDLNTGYTAGSAAFTLNGAAQSITTYSYVPTHTVIFGLPDLAPSAIGYFTYTALVDNDLAGASAVTNTAAIGAAQIDADATDNTSSVALPAAAGINLYVDESAQPSPDPAVPGGTLLYTVRYGNLGSATATNVVLTDFVPINTTYVANSLYLNGTLLPDDTHYLSGSGLISVTWPTLNAGASGTLTFTVQIAAPLNAGVEFVSNTASISATGGSQIELLPGDNQATVIVPINAQPDLSIAMSENPHRFLNGQSLTYILTYQNLGNQTTSNVIITASVSSNFTYIAVGQDGVYEPSTGLITWTLPTLAADDAHTVAFSATIGPRPPSHIQIATQGPIGGGEGLLRDQGPLAAVRAQIGDDGVNGMDADLSNNVALDADVIARPYIVLENRASTPVYTGEPVTYTITYQNVGAATAENVIIIDTAPTNAMLGSIFNGGTPFDNIITWDIGAVAAGASGSVEFVATPLTTSGSNTLPAPTLSTETGSGTIVISTTTTNVPSLWCDSASCTTFKTIWQGSDPIGPAGWHDHPRLPATDFDDADWPNATAVSTIEGYWTDAANVGAEWVTPMTLTQFAPSYSFFRQFMCLPLNADNLQASLTIASDDLSEVYLNGELAGTHQGSGSASLIDVSQDVQAGINLMAVRLLNNNHGGHSDYDGGDHIGLLYNLNANYSSLRPFVAAPTAVQAGQPVSFIIDENALGGAAPYSYTVDFGGSEGTQAYTASTTWSHVYSTPGVYTAVVTARAQSGCTGQDTIVINVVDATRPLLINYASVSYANVNTISYAGESGVGEPLQNAVNLDISNTSTGAPLVAGQSTITYTVIVTNSGAETAIDAAISDTLPAEISGVTWTCTPSTDATCTANASGALDDTVTLPPDGTLTYLLTGTVRSSVLGDVVNTVFALPPTSYSNVGAGSATDSQSTSTEADMSVSKATLWFTGINVITYTIIYSNTGPSDAREVFITDTLPISVTYQGQVGATPAIDPLSPIGPAYTWYAPVLPANTMGSIVYTVTINTGITGMLTNSVSITATTLDTSPGNNLYQASVQAFNGTPMGVILAAFDVQSMTGAGGDYNRITWETASELNTLGFNLWRGTLADGPDVKLNSFVLPSQVPGGTDGATYHYEDLDIPRGQTYYYWLEDVELNGTVTRHGPVAALGTAPTAITLTGLHANSRTTDLPDPLLGLFGAVAVLVLFKRRRVK